MKARRQLNIKAAGLVLGVVILLGAGLAVLHSYQVYRNSGVLLEQAHKALKDNQPDKALRYFGLYLSFQPDDLDARAQYGLTLEKHAQGPADHQRALLTLDGVLRSDPTNNEVHFALIHCLINVQRLREAIEHAEKLLPDWDKKGELEHMLGWCCEADKQYEKSARWFRKAIAADPKNVDSYMLLADVLRDKLKAPEKAMEVMNDLVKANPDSFRSYLLRRRTRLLLNKDDKASELALAEKDLQRAIEKGPEEPDVVLAAADSSYFKGKTEDARAMLTRGLKKHPGEPALYKALAQLEMSAGKPTDAHKVLQEGVHKLPQAWDLLVLLTDLSIDLGKEPASVEPLIAEMRKRGPTSPLADYFQARLFMQKRQWPEAIALLERTRELVAGTIWSTQVHLQLGWCFRQTGDAEQQLLAYSRAASEQPSLAIASAGRGSALLALGRLNEALEYLQQATRSAALPSHTTPGTRTSRAVPPEAWTDLARCLMLRNLRLPEKNRDWDEVNQAFNDAKEHQKPGVGTVILQAEIEMAQKKYDSAGELLENARSDFPKSILLECALADLMVRQQDIAGALDVLDRADKTFGKSLEIRRARLRLWSQQAGAKSRQEVFALGAGLQDFSALEQAGFLRDLAETWVRLGDVRMAEHIWRRLIEEKPADVRARLALLELSLQSGKVEAARQIVADLRRIEGEKGVCWHYGAAALLLAESFGPDAKLDQARKHLAECYRSRRDWGRLPLLEGQIDEIEGKYKDAIKHYTAAFNLGERMPRLVYRLVKLYQDRRDFLSAETIFRSFEEQGPLQPDMARLGAELALGNNELKRALALGQQAVPANSRDYRDYVWLARLYQANNEFDTANEKLRFAVEYAPHTPETWVAIVENLALSGGTVALPRLLSEVRKKVPPERLAFTLARCHEVLGQFDLAEQYYRQALAQHPNDIALLAGVADFFRQSDQPAKAVPFLQKLLDPSSSAPFALQAPARQQLALILAGTGQSNGIARALDLLGNGAYPDDECTRFLVLGFDPSRRKEALKSFEEIRKLFPVSAEELFYFARAHEAAGNLDHARVLLLDLVTSYADNPQYLAQCIRTLLRVGEPNGAATYFLKLQKREPDSPRTRDLKAQIAKARPGR